MRFCGNCRGLCRDYIGLGKDDIWLCRDYVV